MGRICSLRFWILTLKKRIYIYAVFLDFDSLDWKKNMYNYVLYSDSLVREQNSSLLLLQIEGRNLHKTSFPRFCFLTLKKEKCIIHGFLGFSCFGTKKMGITNDSLRFASWYWRKDNAQLIISLVLFPSIQERNLQISSLLRFGFLRLKEGIWVTHGRFGFESLNWRKECVYAGVSSILLP